MWSSAGPAKQQTSAGPAKTNNQQRRTTGPLHLYVGIVYSGLIYKYYD